MTALYPETRDGKNQQTGVGKVCEGSATRFTADPADTAAKTGAGECQIIPFPRRMASPRGRKAIWSL
jgi:hypothetical protein